MNERIKQLATQAEMYVDLNGNPWPKWMSAEECELAYAKFAELVVRECVTLADTEAERYSNLDQEYCSMAMDNYRELVLKHFGVEE
jgi:hypothetical protein